MNKKNVKRTTIPLDRDATGRFLPAIIAVMVLLASLMLCGALLLGQSLYSWRGGLDQRVTVQIMPLDERTTPLPERVSEALEALRASPLVAEAHEISAEDMSRLLSPWLGEGDLPSDLPVPALIDVTLKEQGDLAPLQSQISAIAGAQLDDHGTWLHDVRRLAKLCISAAFVMVLLIAGAAALILVLLVRAGLNMHRDVVELLHLVGASDGFIARQFQRHMLWVASLGAAIGCVATILLLLAIGFFSHRIGWQVAMPWWSVPVIPLLFVGLSAYTTQHTARRMLAELP